MKKFLLSLSLFAMTLMAGAQEPTLKARSIYDVNQDDKVTVQDVPALANKLLGKADDKTAVDTQSLLDVLSKIWNELSELRSKVSEYEERFLGLEDKLGVVRHEYVDLGLPSGTLWATCNVGAEKPEDAGLYFAWGETVGYGPGTSDGKNGTTTDGRKFDWASYKWMDHSKNSQYGCLKYTFADNKRDGYWYSGSTYVGTTVNGKTYKTLTKLEAADDAATANWGGNWRMPTKAEQDELRNTSYCTWEWTTVNGVNGYKVTSKVSGYVGNSIFLPASGYRLGSNLYFVGSNGYYWSSELNAYNSDIAYYLFFGSSLVDWNNYSRCYGQSVRPVAQKK